MTRDTAGKAQRPPAGEPWIWIPRRVLTSAAWRGLGINARRVVDFLLVEHMAHGGRHNGKLKAPFRQLMQSGISNGRVSAAIHEVEEAELVIVRRGGMRVATVYALAWLPQHDGAPAHPAWQNQESATGSGGRAATGSGGRHPKSATASGGRTDPHAATGSGGAIKKSNRDRCLSIGSHYRDEVSDAEEPLGSDEWDT